MTLAILAAVGRLKYGEIKNITAKSPLVVLATMEGSKLKAITNADKGSQIPVYLYETG